MSVASALLKRLLPAALLLPLLAAVAQDEAADPPAPDTPEAPAPATEEPPAPVDTGPMIEFVVTGERPDESGRADDLNAEMLRQQMYDEIERLREEETIAWRESNLTFQPSEESRISFGYDPVRERDLREVTDINEMPGQTVRPATLFRAQF